MTLESIPTKAKKYKEDSNADIKINNLAKNPDNGGTPANENKTNPVVIANTLFDFTKEDKSVMFLLFELFSNSTEKIIDHKQIPVII